MNQVTPSGKIYAAQSQIIPEQRGVFARSAIKKGGIVEICPIIEISQDDTAEINEESLVSYMFYHGEKALIALGFGSLYNHSDNPNALYTINPKDKTITFTAVQNISKDEEILVQYTKTTEKPLWFMR